MRTALFTILKNIIILALLIVTLVYVFSVYIRHREFMLLFYVLGALYLAAGLLEVRSYRMMIVNRPDAFSYVTDGAVAKSVIKIALFLVVGIVLYISGSIIKYMALLCFLRSALELATMLYKLFTGSMFIYFEGDEIRLFTTKPARVYAGELVQVNFRHGLAYLVKSDGKSITLRTDVMRKKEEFTARLRSWAAEYKVALVEEP